MNRPAALARRLQSLPALESRLFFARFFARIAVECSYFIGVFGTATYAMGSDAFGISSMMLLGNLFIVTGTAVAGPVVDRLGPRITLIGSSALTALVFLVYATLPDSMATLMTLMALWSFLIGFTNTGFATYPPYLVKPDRLKAVNGLMSVANNTALVAGPLMGAALVLAAPVKAVFVLAAVFWLASVAVAWKLEEVYHPTDHYDQDGNVDTTGADEAASGGKLRYLLEGFKATFTTPALAILFWLGFFGFFAYGAFDSLETLYYRDVLQVSVDYLGWLTAALGVGCVLGSAVVIRLPRRMLTLRAVALMLLVTGVGTMVYVGTNIVGVAILGNFLTGVGFGMLSPARDTLVQMRSNLAVTGRVMSVMSLGLQLSGVIPLFVAPFLAQAFGVQPVLVAASVVATLLGAGFFVGIPKALDKPEASE